MINIINKQKDRFVSFRSVDPGKSFLYKEILCIKLHMQAEVATFPRGLYNSIIIDLAQFLNISSEANVELVDLNIEIINPK